jgi:hypothetical protein
MAEAFPRARRSASYALTYTLAVSVFGGAAQFAITWLMRETHSRMVPAWWLISASAAGLAAGFVMPVKSARRAELAVSTVGHPREAGHYP